MTVPIAVVAILGLLMPLPTQRPAKTTICHFDDETMEYKLLSLPEPAVEAHLENHEMDAFPGQGGLDDQCQPSLQRTFARAWINRDLIAGYDPATDIEVARLEDSNEDGLVSAGDTVITSVFPVDLEASGTTPAMVTDHVVSSVLLALDGRILLVAVSGDSFEFVHSSVIDDYREVRGRAQVHLHDHYFQPLFLHDTLVIQLGAPSQPATAVSLGRGDATDDPFIDVEIDLAGGR